MCDVIRWRDEEKRSAAADHVADEGKWLEICNQVVQVANSKENKCFMIWRSTVRIREYAGSFYLSFYFKFI